MALMPGKRARRSKARSLRFERMSTSTRRSSVYVPPPTVEQRVARAISRSTETKQVAWYDGPVPSNGTYAQWSYVNQNATITSNTTDILRLIPQVVQGTGDNQRIGERISPKSLIVKGACTVLANNMQPLPGFKSDMVVVIYVLQHVTLKSYAALTASNDFTQLLRTGENTTAAFQGTIRDAQMPVEDAYYRLLKMKKIRLRYAGVQPHDNASVPPNQWISVDNSHSFSGEFQFNLSKHLPKQFKYPESASVAGANDPTNSSIFMCVGQYQMNGTVVQDNLIAFQYMSQLKYKDS
nr:MAG: capsid protein [Chemarfal virus 264]